MGPHHERVHSAGQHLNAVPLSQEPVTQSTALCLYPVTAFPFHVADEFHFSSAAHVKRTTTTIGSAIRLARQCLHKRVHLGARLGRAHLDLIHMPLLPLQSLQERYVAHMPREWVAAIFHTLT